jgi:ATP-dependent Lon protease
MSPLPIKMDDGPEPCAKFLAESRDMLDKAVYGMQPAKTQIMQVLAQWIANPGSVGNVIALKGPMGVGKTSFARNGVASVLRRPFEFFSLGGATDSANFVGHSYTYEGSMWGRVVDSLINARTMNPVMYFDELDKVSETAQGQEIASMLIHLTDRSQNNQFHDRYFAGVDLDVSQCLFVFSFNDESKIHPILKDRMQVITCTGYSADDKFQIVDKYIWPQMLERTNFKDLTIKPDAIKFLIREYSSEEEGVRTLIRALETLTTRINLLRIADETTAKSYKFYTKIGTSCCIDTDMATHILQDMSPQHNESWRHIYV